MLVLLLLLLQLLLLEDVNAGLLAGYLNYWQRAIDRSSSSAVNQPNKTNGSPRRDSSHKAHLHAALDASHDVVSPCPAAHDTRLDVPESQQRERHDGDAVVQRDNHAAGDEVRDERDEAADEVADGEGDGGDPGLVAVRGGLFVVDRDEEVEQAVVRAVDGGVDLGDGVLGQAERGEGVVDNGRGFGGRGLDELFCFSDGGVV